MITVTQILRMLLASDDQRDTPAMSAQVGRIYPERVFVARQSVRLVAVALTKPADRMRVFMVISAADGRNFGVAFSLS